MNDSPLAWLRRLGGRCAAVGAVTTLFLAYPPLAQAGVGDVRPPAGVVMAGIVNELFSSRERMLQVAAVVAVIGILLLTKKYR